MKRIEIIVAPDGSTRIQTKGFTGSQCQAASKCLEQALGQKTQETLTSEFYQEATQSQRLKQQ